MTRGEKLKWIQKLYRLTVQEVADVCCTGRTQVSRWRSDAPSIPDSSLKLLGLWLVYEYPNEQVEIKPKNLNDFYKTLDGLN